MADRDLLSEFDFEIPGKVQFPFEPVSPDFFLHKRRGPWPQPSTKHPIETPPQVINVPVEEQLIWAQTIGARYVATRTHYAGIASLLASLPILSPDDPNTIVSDDQFDKYMFGTCFTRFLRETTTGTELYDFRAMRLVEPMAGTYVAPTRVIIHGSGTERQAQAIEIYDKAGNFVATVPRGAPAWPLAKAFALQGAAYHMLFSVHPSQHFPLDAVNAVTKTALPYTHPIYQCLFPHTHYSLMVNNVVLDGRVSILNDNVDAQWSSPLTGNAKHLAPLFNVGYHGWDPNKTVGPGNDLGDYDAYPKYNFAEPQQGFDSEYGKWLGAYYDEFLKFGQAVAKYVLNDLGDKFLVGYTQLWAQYLSELVKGFPDETRITDQVELGKALASFMFQATVSHGGDHASYGRIPPHHLFLRIRVPPPKSALDTWNPKAFPICTRDDLYRAYLAREMFFRPHTMAPTLLQTLYPFTDPTLRNALVGHKARLYLVSEKKMRHFMPLTLAQAEAGTHQDSELAEIDRQIFDKLPEEARPDPIELWPRDKYADLIPASIQF